MGKASPARGGPKAEDTERHQAADRGFQPPRGLPGGHPLKPLQKRRRRTGGRRLQLGADFKSGMQLAQEATSQLCTVRPGGSRWRSGVFGPKSHAMNWSTIGVKLAPPPTQSPRRHSPPRTCRAAVLYPGQNRHRSLSGSSQVRRYRSRSRPGTLIHHRRT